MKKLALFAIALLASVVSFAVQPKRIYAYGLSVSVAENVYTFSFNANETPTAGKLVFYDATSSEKVGETALENLVLGKNEVTIAAHQLPGDNGQQLNWAIELSAAAVESIDALNDPTLSQFKFYLPQDVAVDNSPESDFFGRVYVANPGTASGYVAAGISVYDQELNKLGDGYKATGHTISARQDIHRLAVQPQTGKIYYAKTGSSTAIYELIPNQNGSLSDGGSSVNVISGVSEIKNANSLCFDEKGLLWILNYANYVDAKTTGVIYSVDNKAATLFTKNDPNVYKWVSNDNAITPDGLGGFWVAQYRSNFDGFYVLSHVNKEGVLDFYINNTTNNTLIPTSGSSGSINASYRGHLAYYSKENMLAFGGADRVSLFTVKYDSDGKPTLTKFGETPSIRHTNSNKNIDGIAFDYAGNLYMASATREKLYVYTLPTANNTCEVPAKKASVVTKVAASATLYTVTTNVNDAAMGTVKGNKGTYEEGATATLTAVPAAGHKFLNWTVGEETKTENPLTLTVNSDLTVTANFEALPAYTIIATVNDETMGTVSGARKYYEGETVTLKATANTGHAFVDWSNGATEPTLTFTATKDSTVQANFKVLSYTVALATNDEAKGSVAGAGTYDYGTEVELTATPAEGYELLYWSDRSTENPRTITVNGNKALSAYFVKEYTQEPTFTIEKLWENTNVPASTGNGYQAVGWDGKIYMQDAGNSKIMSYANGTDAAVEYAASGAGQQIAVDEAGNLIVFNAYFATDTPNAVLIYPKGNTEGEAVSFTLLQPARCDFFSASGNIYSAEGGYIYFYCNGKTVINRLKITNGAATAADVTTDVVGGSIYATPQNTNHVMVDIFGNLVTHARSNAINSINVLTNECATFTLPSIKMGTLGGCSFELGGKELWAYHAGATNYSSEWNIYNMTDKKFLSDEVLYAVDKANSTNNACNWLNVQKIDEQTAYIYQFCPKKGVAAWKVTCDTGEEPGTGTAVDNTTVAPQVQKIIRDGQVLIIRDGKTFNMMGQEVR